MSEMKSAFERAMERAESLGAASEEDVKKWKYLPEGEKLAALYLRDEGDLLSELDRYDEEARRIVVEGAQEVMVRNLDLPRNEQAKRTNKKVMEAIKELKRDRAALENVYTKIRRIFGHYEQEGEQQRRQAREATKQEVEARMIQAMQQMGQAPPARMNVETQPQFQQEWRKVLTQLDSQYLNLLDEAKQEIRGIR